MADNKISDLPEVTTLTDSDLLEFEQPNEPAGLRSRNGKLTKLLAWIVGKTHAMTAAINEARAADIASAATTDIGAATGNLVHVTGTTTITALGTVQAGTRRRVVFDAALVITHNATSLILPTAANITTAAGDTAEFVSEGAGNWRCTGYLRASGAALTGSGGGGGGGGGGGVYAISVASDMVVTGTTEVPAGEVTLPEGRYSIQFYIHESPSNGSGRFANLMRFSGTGGYHSTQATFGSAAAGSGWYMFSESGSTSLTNETFLGAPGSAPAGVNVTFGTGFLTVPAGGITAYMGFAQAVASGNLTIKAGSYITFTLMP